MTEPKLRKLAEEIGNGNKAAEEQLAQYFGKRLLKNIFSVAKCYGLKNKQDILEICQETLSALIVALRNRKYQGDSLGAFAYGIYKRQCKQWLTKLNREKHGGKIKHISIDNMDSDKVEKFDRRLANIFQAQAKELLQSRNLHKSPLENLIEKEQLEIVKQCIKAMKNKEYKEVFELILKNHDRNEISKILDLPVKRVDEIMCHGKRILKKCVNQKL